MFDYLEKLEIDRDSKPRKEPLLPVATILNSSSIAL
jgi:hypothetical protein